MTREPKFRAWIKPLKCYADSANILTLPSGSTVSTAYYCEEGFLSEMETPPQIFRDDQIILEQYTGLKDKNGVEIFERDNVKAHYFFFDGVREVDAEISGVVIYSENCAYGIGNEPYFFDFDHTSHFEEPCIEIIGNVNQNPELLEGE